MNRTLELIKNAQEENKRADKRLERWENILNNVRQSRHCLERLLEEKNKK